MSSSNETQYEEIDLTAFDDDFAAAPEPERGGDKVPEGKYTARIERVYFRNAKSSGKPMLSWELAITGPTSVGRKLFRNNMLERLEWVKKDLRTCGVMVGKLSELDLNLLLDLEVEVQVKHNGDNSNVYVNKLVGAAGEKATTDRVRQTTVDDGVIPF